MSELNAVYNLRHCQLALEKCVTLSVKTCQGMSTLIWLSMWYVDISIGRCIENAVHFPSVVNRYEELWSGLCITTCSLPWTKTISEAESHIYCFATGIILCMGLANEGRRYIVTSSLIGWPHNQNYTFDAGPKYRTQMPIAVVSIAFKDSCDTKWPWQHF